MSKEITKSEIIERLKEARAKAGGIVGGVRQSGVSTEDIDAIIVASEGKDEEDEKEIHNGATDEKISDDQDAFEKAEKRKRRKRNYCRR